MKRLTALAAACVLTLGFAAQALAHTPICSCFDEGDGNVTCEGGFSDDSRLHSGRGPERGRNHHHTRSLR